MPLPIGDDAWEEVLRDLARSLNGGTVFIIGQKRLFPIKGSTSGSPGRIGPEACNEALGIVREEIAKEIREQGECLTAAGQPSSSTKVDPVVLRELVLQVAAHISVGPGVEVAMQRGLSPNLWQPIFAICIGDGQVRVLTFAFIGGPVSGDRPDRKRTPFCLRIATGDLVRVAAKNAYGQHRTAQARHSRAAAVPAAPRSAAATVNYVCEAVPETVQTTLDYIVRLEDELFSAIEDGLWSDFLRDGKAEKVALAHAACAVSGLSLARPGPADSGLAAAAAAVSGVPLSLPVVAQELRVPQVTHAATPQVKLGFSRAQSQTKAAMLGVQRMSPFVGCGSLGALGGTHGSIAFVEGNGGV